MTVRTLAEIIHDGVVDQGFADGLDTLPRMAVNGTIDLETLADYIRDAYTLRAAKQLQALPPPALIHDADRDTIGLDDRGWFHMGGAADGLPVRDPDLYLPALLMPWMWDSEGAAQAVDVPTSRGLS